MIEVLFVLVIVFVAYVFCCALSNTPSKSSTSATETVQTETVVENINPKPITEQTPPEATKAPETVVKPAARPKSTTSSKKGLKNPTTGEVVSNYSNYAFTKRWIKEALVAEGLLDKIYKNSELNADLDAAIKAAIAQLEQMDKYKP